MSKKQYSKELKMELVKKHIEDGISYWKLGKEYGIEASIIRRWGQKYATFGEAGLEKQNADLCNYSAEFKKKIVLEYLEGNITSQDLAYKYKIHAPSTVRTWIKQYNNHKDLTDSRKEGVCHMVKNNARQNTTIEERVTIVEECINTGCDYSSVAVKYSCSYGQVYSWVKKYVESIGLWTLLYIILAIAIVIGCIAYFGSKYFDKPNRWIMTATTIGIIAVSSEMIFQPRYNVILTWLVIQALVPAIRYLMIPFIGSFCEEWKYMDTEKQQDYGIVVTGIAVIVGFGMLLIAINPIIIMAIPIAALIVMIKF